MRSEEASQRQSVVALPSSLLTPYSSLLLVDPVRSLPYIGINGHRLGMATPFALDPKLGRVAARGRRLTRRC